MSNELITHDGALAEAVTEAQRIILSQQTPKDVLRWRRGRGGKMLAYVDHAFVTDLLNRAFGWSWDFETDEAEILTVNGKPFEIKVRGRLTVRTPRGSIVKMQYGCQPVEFLTTDPDTPVSLGDAFKGAASDALKKCASLLGVALDLYDSDNEVHQPAKPASRPQPASSAAVQPATGGNSQTRHWIDDDKTRQRFWRWVKDDLHLTEADVHAALNVEHVRDFNDTTVQAKARILAWIDAQNAKVQEDRHAE